MYRKQLSNPLIVKTHLFHQQLLVLSLEHQLLKSTLQNSHSPPDLL